MLFWNTWRASGEGSAGMFFVLKREKHESCASNGWGNENDWSQ